MFAGSLAEIVEARGLVVMVGSRVPMVDSMVDCLLRGGSSMVVWMLVPLVWVAELVVATFMWGVRAGVGWGSTGLVG